MITPIEMEHHRQMIRRAREKRDIAQLQSDVNTLGSLLEFSERERAALESELADLRRFFKAHKHMRAQLIEAQEFLEDLRARVEMLRAERDAARRELIALKAGDRTGKLAKQLYEARKTIRLLRKMK